MKKAKGNLLNLPWQREHLTQGRLLLGGDLGAEGNQTKRC